MSYVDFRSLKPTTMTLILSLSGSIDRDTVFSLLPVDKSTVECKSGQKLPHPGRAGVILSARYKGCIRGMVRKKTREPKKEKKWFKHSVTMDISTREKTVNMKVSANKIHLCGATSMDQGREAVEHLIVILREIQSSLDYLHANPERWSEVERWLSAESTGYFEGTEALDVLLRRAPSSLDGQMLRFITRSAHEFHTIEQFRKEMEWMHTATRVIEEPLAIEGVSTAMIKYNFDLGFNVNRQKLSKLMNECSTFKSRYDNSSEHYVSIRKPYDNGEDVFTHRKKNKIPGHKFSVYESGIVTQSGRGDNMEQVYNEFNNAVQSIRSQIMKSGTHLLRYMPSYEDGVVAIGGDDGLDTFGDSTTEMEESVED